MRSSSSRVMRGLAWGLLGSVAGSFCAGLEWGGVARADAPKLILYFVSLYHAACTLIECGSPEQQAKYLPGSCRATRT